MATAAIETPDARAVAPPPQLPAPAAAGAVDRSAIVGTFALAGLLLAMIALAITTAAGPSSVIPKAGPQFFPGWLAGPLGGLGPSVSIGVLEALIVAICVCYAVILRYAAAISSRRLWSAIILAHLAALLAPPLFSGDVFGYIGFARLDVLHGLSPYLFTASAAPHDAIYHLSGWTNLTTPYGPLFTLLTDALVPFGIAGGVWALKGIAALTSLATVVLIWRVAPRMGRSRRASIAFYGLNPLVLVFAVPGAHNEALIGMFVAAGAICILAGQEVRGGLALVAASAIKASAARASVAGQPRRWRWVWCSLQRSESSHSGHTCSAWRARWRPNRARSPATASRRCSRSGSGSASSRWASASPSWRCSVACSSRRCGAPGAARRGLTPTAGRRLHCLPAPPGCFRGTACGRCCRRR
jgi:hypothetical protein